MQSLLQSYSKLYASIRDRYPNVYIVLISIIVTVWFQGMVRIIEKLVPDNSFKTNLVLMVVPIILLYCGDEKLDEIYNFEALQKRITAIARVEN